jgi:hypothetical protein
MQVWLRFLIVWFIAIALPAQGMAGVTMAHCGQSHDRMGAATEASHHRHAAHDASTAHQHDADIADGADGADQVDDTMTAQAKEQPGKLSDLGQYKCSSCASCCAGAALPSAMPRALEVTAALALVTEKITVDAFASDGPDRPPRIYLV